MQRPPATHRAPRSGSSWPPPTTAASGRAGGRGGTCASATTARPTAASSAASAARSPPSCRSGRSATSGCCSESAAAAAPARAGAGGGIAASGSSALLGGAASVTATKVAAIVCACALVGGAGALQVTAPSGHRSHAAPARRRGRRAGGQLRRARRARASSPTPPAARSLRRPSSPPRHCRAPDRAVHDQRPGPVVAFRDDRHTDRFDDGHSGLSSGATGAGGGEPDDGPRPARFPAARRPPARCRVPPPTAVDATGTPAAHRPARPRRAHRTDGRISGGGRPDGPGHGRRRVVPDRRRLRRRRRRRHPARRPRPPTAAGGHRRVDPAGGQLRAQSRLDPQPHGQGVTFGTYANTGAASSGELAVHWQHKPHAAARSSRLAGPPVVTATAGGPRLQPSSSASSAQTTQPSGRSDPQRRASWSTSRSPRPPASAGGHEPMARERPTRGRGRRSARSRRRGSRRADRVLRVAARVAHGIGDQLARDERRVVAGRAAAEDAPDRVPREARRDGGAGQGQGDPVVRGCEPRHGSALPALRRSTRPIPIRAAARKGACRAPRPARTASGPAPTRRDLQTAGAGALARQSRACASSRARRPGRVDERDAGQVDHDGRGVRGLGTLDRLVENRRGRDVKLALDPDDEAVAAIDDLDVERAGNRSPHV